ncbi:MAG: PmoA family protein [Planctomycetaceae bacterium]
MGIVWIAGFLLLEMLFTTEIFAGEAKNQLRLVIVVKAGGHARQNCPMVVALPDEISNKLKESKRNWSLSEMTADGTQIVPSQVLSGQSLQLAWIVSGIMVAGTERMFVYEATDKQEETSAKSGVSVVEDEKNLEVRLDGKPVLRYRMAHVEPPAGADPKFGRSGYIHPVWTLSGAIVTDEFPSDHLHQDGIFLAYTKTEFEGREPNFWDLLGGTGFVRFADKLEVTNGPVCGGFRVRHEHVDAGVSGGKVALNEEWEVRVWKTDFPAAATNADRPVRTGYRFDITSKIECATASPLKLAKYHYGGMAVRGAGNWVMNDVSLVTSEGADRIAGNHNRVPWVDLSGKNALDETGDTWSGVTVFTDPANFRFPEPVRLHPTMPYFVYAPSALDEWSIVPGIQHLSRYHYFVHDGRLNVEEVIEIWKQIVDPPVVEVKIEIL